ncbi:MAG: ABC transporter substrate-binding protein [Bacillota bacterium]
MIERGTGKIVLFVLIVIFVFGNFAAAREITDLAGRTVEIPEEVDKIAAAGPGSLRIIVYLQADNLVAGVEEFEKRNQQRPYILAKNELTQLPVIGPQFGGDAELIASVNPDLIIMSYIPASEADKMTEKTGIPVVLINDGSAGSMAENEMIAAVEFLADILDKKERAAEMKEKYLDYKSDLKRRVKLSKAEPSKKIYIGGIGFKGAQGITSTETDYLPFRYLNIENAASQKGGGNIMISREQLLLWDPEVIFVDQGGINLVKKDLKRPEIQYLSAVKNDDLFALLPYNHYTTNFATLLADAYYIGKIVYPDNFKDIEPSQKADEIYNFFVGEEVYGDMAEIFGGFGRVNF